MVTTVAASREAGNASSAATAACATMHRITVHLSRDCVLLVRAQGQHEVQAQEDGRLAVKR